MDKKRTWMAVLLSLLVSVLLWSYVVTTVSQNSTEVIENIPVTFVGEETLRDRNLTITSGRDSTVTLRITGKRSIVTSLDSNNVTLSIDVSKIQAADEFTRSYSISYPNSIQASSLTVESRSLSNITFTVEELVKKEVPVKVLWKGTLAEDYLLESCLPTVNSISVTGTASRVDPVSKAVIIVDDENISAGFTRDSSYTLMNEGGEETDMTGLTVDTDTVGVTAKVRFTKQIPLAIAIAPGGGADEANVMWEISPAFITISGEEAILNDMNKVIIETVGLSSVEDDCMINRPIILPNGVHSESGEISADISIKLVGLSKKTIKVSNVSFANEPNGYVAESVTNSVSVTVRGPAASVNQLAAGNVRVVADISDNSGNSGNYTCSNVRVFVDSAANDCGVLGSYTVSYKLMTEEEYQESLDEKIEDPGKVS